MCAGPELLFMAATAARGLNHIVAANRRDEEAEAALRRQQQIGQEGNEAVRRRLAELSSRSAADEQRAAERDYSAAVRESLGRMRRGYGADFDRRAERSNAEVSERVRKLADLMSRVDAVQDDVRRERYRTGDTASKVNRVSDFARGQQFVDQLKIRAIQPNPWIDLLAGAGQGYSMSKI